jgi:predicted nucleic acid-binding protein
METSLRANCFDASALVKAWVDEPDCGPTRLYFNLQSPTKYTTPFCYFETLSTLKRKWLRGDISKTVYLDAAFGVTVWFQAAVRQVKDLALTHPPTFVLAREIVERYEIDLSDAFQILSVKEGYFSPLVQESRTLLVTADRRLAEVAEAEGIQAWYCLEGRAP